MSARLAGPLKRAAAIALREAGHLRRVNVSPPRGTALTHSAQFLLRQSPVPYVADFEDATVFALYQRVALERRRGHEALARALADDSLRALLPWTDAARRGLLALLGDEAAAVEPRVHTVLPAIAPVASSPRRRTGALLRVLLVGSTFLGKGGLEAVRAVGAARSTHDIELDLVSVVPPSFDRELAAAPGVRVHTRIAGDALERLYGEAHVLLFPAHVDTLGWVVFEAMARALPVIASDHFALPELVEHEVSGLLFEHESSLYGSDSVTRYRRFSPTAPPRAFGAALAEPSEAYVDRIAAALVRLAEDGDLTERLSTGALERVRSGPLSIERRRDQLTEIYARAAA